MKISRQGDENRRATHRSDTFTGDVWGEPLVTDLPDATANSVLFAPGARTHWHRHQGGQILHVTGGQGKVGTRDGEVATVLPGDTVWAPPDEEHYHGADLHRHLTHVAISFGRTEWLEPVSDQDYGATSDQR